MPSGVGDASHIPGTLRTLFGRDQRDRGLAALFGNTRIRHIPKISPALPGCQPCRNAGLLPTIYGVKYPALALLLLLAAGCVRAPEPVPTPSASPAIPETAADPESEFRSLIEDLFRQYERDGLTKEIAGMRWAVPEAMPAQVRAAKVQKVLVSEEGGLSTGTLEALQTDGSWATRQYELVIDPKKNQLSLFLK
jgi:hypothetical protein